MHSNIINVIVYVNVKTKYDIIDYNKIIVTISNYYNLKI